MVQLTRIYTRGGDKGRTSLGNGTRVEKHHARVEAYGTVDEANAVIGLARLHLEGEAEAEAMLERIQNDLFDLGGDLCIPPKEGEAEGQALRVQDSQVERLEREIDGLNAELQPLKSFVLPGGSPAAAWLHLARTVVRRAERATTKLAGAEPVNPAAIRYLNRLSDHLFVLARWSNGKGSGDVLWKPGAHR
jgi:cob(I)alamin adenosyltransferase